MNEEESLIQGILASPNNDDLRLIYADWLEERGDPRGEFLRLEAELAALSKQVEVHSDARAKMRSVRLRGR